MAGYTVRTIQYREKKANEAGTGTVSVKAPTAATCGITDVGSDYTRSGDLSGKISDDGDGIVIKPDPFDRPAAYATDTPPQEKLGHRRAYLCVQGMDAATDNGRWVLSSVYTVKQRLPPS